MQRVPSELLAAKPKKTKKNAPLTHVEGATGKNQQHMFTRSGAQGLSSIVHECPQNQFDKQAI